ncbi:YaaA family protein, partial [Patulibacter sp. S7RM1-6]
MLLLLPPSEGKTAPDDGAPVELDALAHPELLPVREARLDALRRLSTGDEAAALKALKLGPRSAVELARNRDPLAAPAAPAWRVYTGVLFERLGFATLGAAARRRAHERVLIVSALWGVVRPADRIPAYRCPAGARLPGVPTAKAHWRPALDAVLPADGLVVDLRLGAYRDLWPGPADGATVAVDVVRERDGVRTVVSHDAKATRGAVARALLE